MSNTPNTRQWVSVYLYPTESLDSLLTEVVRLISELKTEIAPEMNWFFIRYQDRFGPHLRLRVASTDDLMRSAFVTKLERIFGLSGLADTRKRQGVTSDGLLQRARWVRYRPEITRYGGRTRMALSELFFQSSSEWVLQHANLLGAGYARRLLMAGITAYLLLRIAIPEKRGTVRLASVIAASWVHTLRERRMWDENAEQAITSQWAQDRVAWSRCFATAEKYLETADITSPFGLWATECRARTAQLERSFRTRAENAAPRRHRIIQSWMHMHLNRMGITNADEALVAFCIAQQFKLEGAI